MEKPASVSSPVTRCQQGRKAAQVCVASGLGSQIPAFCLVRWFRLGFHLPLYRISGESCTGGGFMQVLLSRSAFHCGR